jgi:DNA adenine methylase
MRNSPIAWLGGKKNLRKQIIAKMPKHHCYVEGLCGGAWVLFGKEPSEVEVINDLDDQLINFYTVVKNSPEELKKALAWELVSRTKFNQYKKELKENGLENILKAKNFYYVLKCSYGSMRQSYGYSKKEPPHLNLKEVDRLIHDAYERLMRVYIENLDYQELVPRYDSPETLWYFDPPYDTPASKKYFKSWVKEDYEVFNALLKSIKGKFMISLNVSEYFKELFKWCNIEIVQTTYTVQKQNPRKVEELLITKF